MSIKKCFVFTILFLTLCAQNSFVYAERIDTLGQTNDETRLQNDYFVFIESEYNPGTYTSVQDKISGKTITNTEAISDIVQAERDAIRFYDTAVLNQKDSTVAQKASEDILKAGSKRAEAKQELGAGGNGGIIENFAVFFGSTGGQEERQAKIIEADAEYTKSLSEVAKETGNLNTGSNDTTIYNTAELLAEQATVQQEVANDSRAGVFTANNSDTSSTINTNSQTVSAGSGDYVLLAPISNFFPGGRIDIKGTGLGSYLNGLYKAGIAIATGLALIMIVLGGLEYVSTDSIQGKSSGRDRIQNALIGLLLALASYLILQQINPNLLKSDLQVSNVTVSGGISGQNVSLVSDRNAPDPLDLANFPFTQGLVGGALQGVPGTQSTIPGSGVFAGYSNVRQLLSSLPNGSRTTDGSLIFTNYWNGDTNTNQQRGNNCNLLVSGSLALSPDLIRRYNPRKGAAVYVNALLIGYFDDTTGETTLGYVGGTLIRNTIDIYDPQRSYGSILKTMRPGTWNLSFGSIRAQTPNPCP